MDFKFLDRALNENEPIAIVYKTELGKTLTYGSRFFSFKPNKYIIIDNPHGEKGAYQQLVRKDKITVYFISKGFRFKFSSVVLKRDTFRYQSNTEIPVLIIKMPKEIYDGERRHFFRVPAPMDPPIIVKYVSYFDNNQSFDLNEEPELQDRTMEEAVLHDLSSGGLSIRRSKPLDIMHGDIINLRFKLSQNDFTEIRVEALVNNTRVLKDNQNPAKGLEFMPDRSDAYRNALKSISRYVMNRQREMINLYGGG